MLDFGAVRLEWGTLIFQAVVFLILLWLVSRFAMKPMKKMLANRQDHIQNEIAAAENARKRHEESLKEQKKALEEARNEAYQIVENARKNADAQGEEILKEARVQAQRTVDDAREEINREREKAVAALHDQTAELSVMLASKIMEKELDKEQQQNEIDDFLKQVGDRV